MTGAELRTRRERAGLTQADCARTAHVTERTWARWEHAERLLWRVERAVAAVFSESKRKAGR